MQVHTNSTLARPDDDAPHCYTLIVSHEDPNSDGHFRGNWIETTGHKCGTMCFRWIAPRVPDEQLPHPKAHVLSLETLLRMHPAEGSGH